MVYERNKTCKTLQNGVRKRKKKHNTSRWCIKNIHSALQDSVPKKTHTHKALQDWGTKEKHTHSSSRLGRKKKQTTL